MQSSLKKNLFKPVILLSFAAALVACGDKGGEQQAPPPPAVTVETVGKAAVNSSWEFVGRTVAVQDVNLRARIQGYLESIHFQEGEFVEKGTLLFEIDDQPYIADESRAKADLAKARAEEANANKNYQRGKTLHPQGTISDTEFENLKVSALSAKANVESALAALKTAELNLGYTKISSPIDGVVGSKALSIGDLVTSNDVLLTIVQQDPMHVTFPVNERLMARTEQSGREQRLDGSAEAILVPSIRLANGDTYGFEGRFDFVDNRVDRSTGTINVRAVFPNPDGRLIPGQYVRVDVREEQAQEQVIVPQKSIQQDQLGHYVVVVDAESNAMTQRVELGDVDGINRVVLKGLSGGEILIVEGLQKVRPGQPVKAIDRGQLEQAQQKALQQKAAE
ncbi:Efflux pump periplasmic linker BepF [Sinobacterium norvegicum]|uniref:Efflux pump periplasmic linker BepF n=2 Tax=Sinobacterium norvegicum TaxID=1641715 RepID=A0ABN8EGH9_9GAMM|nr:Efflux pump periplasmic linker BepF [Sinobacterium norvegicum]